MYASACRRPKDYVEESEWFLVEYRSVLDVQLVHLHYHSVELTTNGFVAHQFAEDDPVFGPIAEAVDT